MQHWKKNINHKSINYKSNLLNYLTCYSAILCLETLDHGIHMDTKWQKTSSQKTIVVQTIAAPCHWHTLVSKWHGDINGDVSRPSEHWRLTCHKNCLETARGTDSACLSSKCPRIKSDWEQWDVPKNCSPWNAVGMEEVILCTTIFLCTLWVKEHPYEYYGPRFSLEYF